MGSSTKAASKPLLSDPIIILQIALATFACYWTWGINVTDGSIQRMLDIFNDEVPVLTGTNHPVKTVFTGFAPLDGWIVFMIVFFWEALNGTHPATIIEGFYFFGQVTALWTLMSMEGKRLGNKGLIIAKAMMWLYITHNLTIACFAPVFFILYQYESSPTNRTLGVTSASSRVTVLDSIRKLRYIPLSIFLGLVVPFNYTGLPSPDVISYDTQQNMIFITIFYPTWVACLNYGFAWLDATLYGDEYEAKDLHDGYIRALRIGYIYAIVFAGFMHIGVVTTSLASLAYPGVFAEGIPELFHPLNLLLPTNPPVYTIGQGIFGFMKRDQWLGYISVWLWVLKCYQEHPELSVKSVGGAVKRALTIAAGVSLFGSMGAAAAFLWRRDEMLYAKEKAAAQAATANGKAVRTKA